MESCPTCLLKYKRNKVSYFELTNNLLETNSQYYCLKCIKVINLADRRSRFQSNEH